MATSRPDAGQGEEAVAAALVEQLQFTLWGNDRHAPERIRRGDVLLGRGKGVRGRKSRRPIRREQRNVRTARTPCFVPRPLDHNHYAIPRLRFTGEATGRLKRRSHRPASSMSLVFRGPWRRLIRPDLAEGRRPGGADRGVHWTIRFHNNAGPILRFRPGLRIRLPGARGFGVFAVHVWSSLSYTRNRRWATHSPSINKVNWYCPGAGMMNCRSRR